MPNMRFSKSCAAVFRNQCDVGYKSLQRYIKCKLAEREQFVSAIRQFILFLLFVRQWQLHFCTVNYKKSNRSFEMIVKQYHYNTTKTTCMKKVNLLLFTLMALFLFTTSCEKEEHETRTETPETPRSSVPDSYVGKWMGGYFDMAAFNTYDGTRQPNASSMVAYNIKKDGSAEQYIYYDYEDGSDKQVLTYRKGTVTFDAGTATLKFCPSEGTYRLFENGTKTQSTLNGDGLYPAYAPKYRNCTFEEEDAVTYLVGLSDQNEMVGFAKTNW